MSNIDGFIVKGQQYDVNTYTAGEGIEIDEDNVISATGGSMYYHPIKITGDNISENITFSFITRENTSYDTATTLTQKLYTRGFSTTYPNYLFVTNGLYNNKKVIKVIATSPIGAKIKFILDDNSEVLIENMANITISDAPKQV